MGTDGKYGRVSTERGNGIPEDEPVFLFRAQDRMSVATIEHYRLLCIAEGSPQEHIDGIQMAQARFLAWQAQHPDVVKTPDSRYHDGR